jgi:hypothetical protein
VSVSQSPMSAQCHIQQDLKLFPKFIHLEGWVPICLQTNPLLSTGFGGEGVLIIHLGTLKGPGHALARKELGKQRGWGLSHSRLSCFRYFFHNYLTGIPKKPCGQVGFKKWFWHGWAQRSSLG